MCIREKPSSSATEGELIVVMVGFDFDELPQAQDIVRITGCSGNEFIDLTRGPETSELRVRSIVLSVPPGSR